MRAFPFAPVSNRDYLLYMPQLLWAIVLIVLAVVEALLFPILAPLRWLIGRVQNRKWNVHLRLSALAAPQGAVQAVRITTARVEVSSEAVALQLGQQLSELFHRGAGIDSAAVHTAIERSGGTIEDLRTVTGSPLTPNSGTISGEIPPVQDLEDQGESHPYQ
ncbi:MAG: hypothetical protein ACRDTS_07790 [Mycobacterium sp.]